MDNEYDDSNRAFLQAFMGRSSMTFEEAQPILAAIISARENREVDVGDITEEHFTSYVGAANTAISQFDLEIRSSLRQTSKQNDEENTDNSPTRVYALVNTTSDSLTQLATSYSADEIAFLKRVLDCMFEKNNTRICEGMVITPMEAVNLRTATEANRRRSTIGETQPAQDGAANNLSLTQAETMMNQLVEEGWFEKSEKSYFSLSPRGLMELRGWLVAEYNDDESDGRRADRIKFCAACKDIITVGQRCGDRECPGRLHDHCMHNFFRIHRAEKCPVCKKDWPGDKYVGERAVRAMNRNRASDARQSIRSPAVVRGYDGNEDEEGGSGEDAGADEEG
ncbi:hypothetical protein N7478_011894 [Penicillium angulare]|uniref:uncharacterized protein n=1 Tax=Penicillium angulare TaxID=116970 RepID=UPI0025423FE0|nr:uncharacterized protein N7478_011894 [Penicillium angulare]KAJ5261299.1 hypothetical protein N7478_011894 [Penicillium angulare]